MNKMSFKVLIADDEPQIREILNVYFTKEGFQVVEAGDGKEAMEKISKERQIFFC
jgi:two-component system response regulator ResD